ncbi:MAG: small multi-drug export protein [Crenarchaeota archaeon]|nr:small multi-drug export protein [Thermoproteota archaeon]
MYELLMLILTALLPGVEARGAIPLGFVMGLNPYLVLIASYIASSLPSIPIILLLEKIEPYLRKYRFISRIYDKFLDKVREKAESVKNHKYVYLALSAYVAVPLPLTGVWTGSFIAYILGLEPRKSIISVFIGNLVASIIVFITVYGVSLLL